MAGVPSPTYSREEQLDFALRRVLSWQLPQGTIQEYAIPGWLNEIAMSALRGDLDVDRSRSMSRSEDGVKP